MGCGASQVTPQNGDESKPLNAKNGKTVEPEPRSNGHTNGSVRRPKSSDRKDSDTKPNTAELNGNVPANPQESRDVRNEQTAEETRHSPSKSSNGVVSHASPQLPLLSKAVAFDIDLGKNGSVSPAGRPPRRLQKIESAPVLTREALEQKQAAAEQNRQKELDKKVKLMSKRRSELLLAREMDKAQQQKVELEVKLTASEKKREKAQAEIKDKQRRREEKAKRVRMRARQMRDGDDVMDLNVDPDETYNADEEDESWDIVSSQSFSRSMGEEDDNNNQRFDDREDAAPQMKDSETKTEQQDQNLNEVHDFFDS